MNTIFNKKRLTFYYEYTRNLVEQRAVIII